MRDRGFGVWKLWEEIARPGNSFVFEFGYGLGLWKKQMVSRKDSPFIRRLLLASEAEERDINDYYATAAGALALWQKVQKQSQAGALDSPPSISPRIEIFADQGDGYNQKVSISEPLVRDTWQTIRLRNLDQIYTDKGRRLRIDPIDCPSLLLLSSIRIVRERDDAVLYGADKPADFEKLQFSDNVQPKIEGENFLLLVTDSDPQIYLPILATLPDEALRAEIALKVETASHDLMIRHAKTWQMRSDLEMAAKSMQVRLAEQENQMRLVEAERDELKKRDEQQRKEVLLLGGERDELKILAEKAEAKIKDLQSNQIRNLEARNQTLSNTLTGLEQNITRFKEFFGLSPVGLERAESPITILIDSLSNLIRRIRRKTPLWKGSQLAGKTLRFTPIQSSSPKTVAKQLKHELQRLKNTLKSKKTSPAAALKALTELIALRAFAKDLVSALSAKSLFLPHQADRSSLAVASAMQALFDPSWYTRKYGYTTTTGMSPLQHYLMVGGRLGYDPHPLFDTRWYLSQRPKNEELTISPLEDYILHGAEKGYSPHPQFDSNFYTKNYPDSIGNGLTSLAQYLTIGWKLGYQPNPHFDPEFYIGIYPDVAAAGLEPLTHFVQWGQVEGRAGSAEAAPFRFVEPSFTIPRTPFFLNEIVISRVKAIAFYLPQFHPIPENDRWWGEGFTEWNNVRAGRPNFPGHYQPHVPADLGYYDLRDPEVLRKQTELAKATASMASVFITIGSEAKSCLISPIRTMLETGKPDFPFCICWANENWTRRWDGREDDVLIAQSHSPEDDVNFIRRVENVLLQKNYIRVRGEPLLLVYRPSLFPDSLETTERWRDYFRRKGHGELHLVMVRSFHDQTDPQAYGFDAAVQFPPHFRCSSV